MPRRDLYEVLGVSPEASPEEIKKAYRRLAREHHPDVNANPEAEQRIKEINLAYQTLSDPVKRRQYDLTGGEGVSADAFGFVGDMADIFEAFFGGSPFRRPEPRTRTRRGADLHGVLELTFEEAAFGVGREVEISTLETCRRCEGNGSEPGTAPSRCTRCGGSGQVSDVRRSVFGTVMTSRTCATCEGTGEEIADPCRECGGDGRRPARQTISVDVPAGVADGMELRVEGAGQGGRHGGFDGDLYVTLRVAPHPLFERHGQDLVAALDLPVSVAMLGGEVEVPTLDGAERLRIPAGTRSGTAFRVRGKGIPYIGRRGRGDLVIQVDLDVPAKLSRKEREVAQELARLEGVGDGPLPARLRPLR